VPFKTSLIDIHFCKYAASKRGEKKDKSERKRTRNRTDEGKLIQLEWKTTVGYPGGV